MDKVEKILSSLMGRKGFDDWWYSIDEDIQEEIKEEILQNL